MNEIIKGFPNKLMLRISNIIMMDQELNKLLYYSDVKDKDIYSLPILDNPISELKDIKVFIDRRIDKVFKKSDICIYINLANDEPYTRFRTTSRFFRTCKIEIGVICHADCRKTLNGTREVIIMNRVKELLCNSNLSGVGEASVEPITSLYNMPYEFNGYSTKLSVDYWGSGEI